jgi:hypothetical protein
LRDGGALCGDSKPLGNLCNVPLGFVKAEYEIIVCYVPRDGYNVHGLHVDCRTVLGPWVHVALSRHAGAAVAVPGRDR